MMALRREPLLIVNHPNLALTDRELVEVETIRPDCARLWLVVAVNPGLDTDVRLLRTEGSLRLPFQVLSLAVLRLTRRAAIHWRKKLLSLHNRWRTWRSASGDRSRAASAAQSPPPTTNTAPAARHTAIRRARGSAQIKQWIRLVGKWQRGLVQRLEHAIAPKSEQAGPRLRTLVLVEQLEELPEFSFPRWVHVALTTHCNLKCIMCPYHGEDLRRSHTTNYFANSKRMPPQLLEKLIREAGQYRSHLGFGQYDEPFVYRNFTDYAVLAKQHGCGVSITTNGTLLHEEAARRLIAAGVDHISFSLDAATEDTYRKIRLDDFRVPLENIKTLVRVRNELGGRTTLRACLVVQDYNRHEQDLFRDRMKAIGLDMVSFYVLSKYVNGIWINERLNFDIDLPAPAQRYACSQLWTQAAVYPDGQVALCCATTLYVGYRDDVPYVGNLHQSGLREIWLSPEYRRIRAEALAGVFANSVCRDCQIWHNYQKKEFVDAQGNRVLQNPYETFVYLTDSP
ncbi:MAG: radical SAM protein [Verrucomicrobiae bacterium]|nr:radical SAM protein [Verrucomicrobiae bacterium]